MFTVNELAIRAEDNYRRNLLRDQNHKTSKTGKTAVVLIASAMLLAACGTVSDTNTNGPNVVATVSDPGPSWEPNFAALDKAEVHGIAVDSFGVFAGPAWQPNAGLLANYLGDHGVFSGPSWAVNQAALDEALGIDRDTGNIGKMEPVGRPNYGLLANYLGESKNEPGPR